MECRLGGEQNQLFLPAARVAQDGQGVGEAVQVVVPDVQGQGLVPGPRYEAPERFPPLEVGQHRDPLWKQTHES